MSRSIPAVLSAALLLALALPAGAEPPQAEPPPTGNLTVDLRTSPPPAAEAGWAAWGTSAAARGFAAADEHWEDWEDGGEGWYVVADCTEVTVFSGDGAPSNGENSPYGWDVTITPAGGDPIPLRSDQLGHMRLGFEVPRFHWGFHGASPGQTYTVSVTPRPGYEDAGPASEFSVTTRSGCHAAPELELVASTRSSATVDVTGAADARGLTAWILGADGQRYDRPMYVEGPTAPTSAETTRVTILFPPGSSHILGFAQLSEEGRGAMGEITVASAGDVRGSRRVAGSDRFETAVQLASETGGRWAVVANGLDFPDALAAANYGQPVLLTTRDELHPSTRRYLERAVLHRVVVAGGASAVSDAVLEEIRSIVGPVTVDRVGGAGRYETAALMVEDTYYSRKGAPPTTMIVASGETHADAVAAGALSAAGLLPLVLTAKGRLPDAAGELIELVDPELVLVAGGPGAVEPQVLDAIRARAPRAEIERLHGRDRTRTAAAIARWGTDNRVFDRVDAILARGDGFADALAASAVARFRRAPVLLSASPTAMGLGVPEFLDAYGCVVEQLIVAGGTAAVSEEMVREQTGPCDPTVADRLMLEDEAMRIDPIQSFLRLIDGDRRPAGHLDYLLGPGTPRDLPFHTAFDAVGDVSVLRYLKAPFAWRVAEPAGDDEVIGPDEVMTLLLDRNGDRTCNAGEPAFDFTLGSPGGTHRTCP